MHCCHPTRALPAALTLLLVAWLAGAVSLPAQSGRRSVAPVQPNPGRPVGTTPVSPGPSVVTPSRPIVTYPVRPGVVTPAKPAVTYPVTPTKPITTYPVSPGVVTKPWPVTKPTYPVKPVPLPTPIPGPGPGPGHDHDHDHDGHHHHPPYPGYPGYYPQYPIVIVPSYPSAYIGPEIISVTTYPTDTNGGTEVANISAPSQGQGQMQQPSDPAALRGDAATPRLVAILGKIERVEGGLPDSGNASRTSTSTRRQDERVGDGDQLCIGVATLTTYYNPDPDQPAEAMARGTYFGSRWDGDSWHTSATGLWSRGPVTRQPIFTLHELQPSAFPFEVARPGRRITSLRMALALVRDSSSPSFSNSSSTAPSASQAPTQPRYVTMANSLRQQLQQTNEPIPLVPLSPSPSSSSNPAPTPTAPELDPDATYLGNAHSPFGQALTTTLQGLLTTSSFPQPSGSVSGNQPSTINQGPSTSPVSGHQPSTKDHQLIGSAEWTLPLSDLRDILSGCPRFTTLPLPADLQTVRSRDTSPAPLWVRPFRIEVGAQSDVSSGHQPSTLNHQPAATYQGEVWFLIVPDGALRG